VIVIALLVMALLLLMLFGLPALEDRLFPPPERANLEETESE
jgi:hypothetical protein